MKKNLSKLVLFVTLLTTVATVQSCSSDDETKPVSRNEYGLDNKFDYREFYDTLLISPVWKSFNSYTERLDATQLPQEALQYYTTEELIDVNLYFPFRANYIAFNDPLMGFDQSCHLFNGYNELLGRKDAARAILEFYDKASLGLDTVRPAGCVYPSTLGLIDSQFIVLVIYSNDFPEMYEGDNLVLLRKVIKEKLERKLSKPDIYSDWSIQFLRAILQRIDG